MGRPEPEREMIRRVIPYAPLVAGVALLAGGLLADWNAGWSAAIGVAIVALNFAAHGLSLAWAARISPTMIFAVGMGGFFIRIVVIVMVMVALNTLAWFSPVAFMASVVPATVMLLVAEGKLLSGRMQADLWTAAPKGAQR